MRALRLQTSICRDVTAQQHIRPRSPGLLPGQLYTHSNIRDHLLTCKERIQVAPVVRRDIVAHSNVLKVHARALGAKGE